jgi:transposase
MSVLGIDIAKQVFHVVGMDDSGHVVLRKRLARSTWLTFMANVPPLRIGMEACGSAHDWARRFREHGHDVRLIAPPCVKASVKSPPHEARDAEAIGEAVTRPTMRFVPITRVAQQDLQTLHRIRERLINARRALVREIRGLLHEYGMVLPQHLATCRAWIAVGWDWSCGNSRRAARHGFSGSVHAGSAIGVNSSFTAREPRPAGSMRRVMTGVNG